MEDGVANKVRIFHDSQLGLAEDGTINKMGNIHATHLGLMGDV